MNSNSAGSRLGIAFAVLIMIILGVGWFGVNRINQISSEANDVLDRAWLKVQASRQAMQDSSANNRIVMEIFLLDDTNQINNLLTERTENTRHISALLAQIEAKAESNREKELLAAIQKTRTPYVQSYKRALDLLVNENQFETARSTLLDETIGLQIKYVQAWHGFVAYQEAQAAEASHRAKNNSLAARRWFILMVATAVLLAAAIAMGVTRSFGREVGMRLRVENELRQAGEKLEERVEERTDALIAANRELQAEIAQRQFAQAELAQEQQRFEVIFETSPEGIFQSTPDGRLNFVNPALVTIYGYASAEEMMRLITNVGTQLYADPARRAEFRRIMEQDDQVRDFEVEARCKDNSFKWVSITACAVRTPDGAIAHYQGFILDITANKRAQNERNLMEIQLRQAQKLESVGQLAAGIAHEINTPIQYVGDNLRFVEESFASLKKLILEYERLAMACQENAVAQSPLESLAVVKQEVDLEYLSQEIPQALQQSLEGVRRVSTIVSAMKEFSHPGNKERVPVDINHAIQTTLTVARNEWKYVADAQTELAPDLPRVPCLPDELNQVILNLVVNAAHAIGAVVKNTGEKGVIKITTLLDGNWAEIRVSDTGAGIPEEIRHRIFEPFFTTKEVGKGTGQGLAIARSTIVNKHNGQLTFETVVGQGATFIIRLPVDAKNKSSRPV